MCGRIRFGGNRVALHLWESPKLDKPITEFVWGNARVPRAKSGVAPDSSKPQSPSAKKSDERSLRRDAENRTPEARDPLPVLETVSFTVGRVPSRGAGSAPSSPAEGSEPATGTVWLDKAQTTGFNGVGEDVWTFQIGGYQLCEQWFKDRKGRALTKDDLTHYQSLSSSRIFPPVAAWAESEAPASHFCLSRRRPPE